MLSSVVSWASAPSACFACSTSRREMSIADRTKTARDESRMLMLGAQVLLGFHFQAPFPDAFALRSPAERSVALTVLGLITIIIGLLIAPSAHHRIVYDGEATAQLTRFVTHTAMVMLP